MPDTDTLLTFAMVSLAMALTPGPNMIYLLSRSLSQGPVAGLISLGGVVLGFICYLLLSAFGITALLFVVPFAYDALRLAGAAYLLWIAWQTVRPGGRSPFQVAKLPPDAPRRLFLVGLITSILNPKMAIFYISLLPQFIDPAKGSVLSQSLVLGSLQISVSMCCNGAIALAAGSVARFLATRPVWLAAQRWVMGATLAGFAVRIATEARR